MIVENNKRESKQVVWKTHRGKLHHVRLHCFDDDFPVLKHKNEHLPLKTILNHKFEIAEPKLALDLLRSLNRTQVDSQEWSDYW